MASNRNNSKLGQITQDDLIDIRNYQLLSHEGYTFHYFTDFRDLHQYCFPLGLLYPETENVKSFELLSDRVSAYSHFFNDMAKHIMIYDEYIDEIRGLDDTFIKIKDDNQTRDRIAKEVERISQLLEDSGIDNTKVDIKSDLSLLEINSFLMLCLGLLSKGISQYKDLEKNKLIITGEKLRNEYNKTTYPYIADWILNTKPNKTSTAFFFELWENHSKAPNNKRMTNNPDAYHYNKSSIVKRRNAYRDCKALSRTLQLNYGSINAGAKHLFIMLSSTQTVSLLTSEFKQLDLLPKIDGVPFNPFISNTKLYYEFINRNNKKIQDSLYKILHISNSTSPQYKFLSERKLEIYKNTLLKYSARYENASLLQYKNFYKLLKEGLNNEIIKSNPYLVENFKALLSKYSDQARNEIEKVKEFTITKIEFEDNFRTNLILGLYNIQRGSKMLKVVAGNDKVFGYFHLIPLDFRFKDAPKHLEITSAISRFYAKPKRHKNESSELFNEISNKIEFLFETPEPSPNELIVQSLVLLMLPDLQTIEGNSVNTLGDTNFYTSEKQLYIYTKFDQIIYNETLKVLKNLEGSKIVGIDIYLDYLYFASWISRRLCLYKDSKKLSLKGIKNKPNDVRFNHNLCLLYYDLYIESVGGDTKHANYLNLAIKNGLIALNYYSKYETVEKLDYKLYIALNNTLSYLLLLKYDLSGEEKDLILANSYFDKLRNSDFNYLDFHELAHTEATIYSQFWKLTKDKKYKKFAIDRIKIAINNLRDCDYVAIEKYSFLELEYSKLLNSFYPNRNPSKDNVSGVDNFFGMK